VDSNPTIDSGPHNTTSDLESEEPRMIGDFDGTASEFWKLFKNEANSHDDALINTLKEGMDSALIFVRSYSPCPDYGLGYADPWPHRLVCSLLPSQHS
jgi:hypothetical protein